ncbi:MAG TPA: hypothetical protein VGC78_07755 [Gaiellaceae bacterium]|jgi:hypothetical protein
MDTRFELRRFAPLLAATGGLAYAAVGALLARSPQPEHHWHTAAYAVEALFAMALALTIPLVPFLRVGRSLVERLAVRASQAGFTAMLVSALASIAVGGDTLGPAFFLGVLGALAGLLALAIQALRARRQHWWASPVAFAGVVLGIALGDHGGTLLLGLAWIAVSIALQQHPISRRVATASA